MNIYKENLKNYMVEYIFSLFGLYLSNNIGTKCCSLFDNQLFLSNNHISYSDEQDINVPIYCGTFYFDKVGFNIMVTNLSTEDEKDFVILFKSDNMSPFFLRKSSLEESAEFLSIVNGKIFEPDIIIKLKFLIGLESLLSVFPKFEKIPNYEDDKIFNLLKTFLVSYDE